MKRIHIDENTMWKLSVIRFPADATGDHAVFKGARNAVSLAKALPIAGWSEEQKREALAMMFELGYARTIELEDGELAIEIVYPVSE